MLHHKVIVLSWYAGSQEGQETNQDYNSIAGKIQVAESQGESQVAGSWIKLWELERA